MSLRSQVAEGIAFHRARAGMSQAELAELADVSMDTVQRCEAPDDSPRARGPSLAVLGRLAGAMGVPVVALILGPEDVAPVLARGLVRAVGVSEALRLLAIEADLV